MREAGEQFGDLAIDPVRSAVPHHSGSQTLDCPPARQADRPFKKTVARKRWFILDPRERRGELLAKSEVKG